MPDGKIHPGALSLKPAGSDSHRPFIKPAGSDSHGPFSAMTYQSFLLAFLWPAIFEQTF